MIKLYRIFHKTVTFSFLVGVLASAPVFEVSAVAKATSSKKQTSKKIAVKSKTGAVQKSKKKSTANATKSKKKIGLDMLIARLTKKLLRGEISNKKAWAEAIKLEVMSKNIKGKEKALLFQLQSKILYNSDYKILSALYASKALRHSEDKYDKVMTLSWSNLKKISKARPIQDILSLMAKEVGIRNDLPPAWDEDWHYILALNHAESGDLLKAVKSYKNLSIKNRNYFPAAYRKAMLLNKYDKNETAISELRALTIPGLLKRAKLSKEERKSLKNLANLALGRIYYEEEKFLKSIYYFRQVEKDSAYYYDALFEQAWALFMNGNPNHALGSLYSLQTPFFNDRYNPESSILKAIIFFWICNYSSSRNALADFLEKHQNTSEIVKRLNGEKGLSPKKAFKLFEARISGKTVKEVPSDVLAYVADQPSLSSSREQLASLLEEKNLLLKNGIFGSRNNISPLVRKLDTLIEFHKKEIGKRLIAEFESLEGKFETLMKQAKFLYVELLMSETKEKLGKNLHEGSTITASKEKTYKRLIGWNDQDNLSWASSTKDEVWWDEVGYHIAYEESKCVE